MGADRKRKLLKPRLRVGGEGAKAWPSKIAKELLGIKGKTVTKRQTILNWAKAAKNIVLLKSKQERREKRLENVYEAKKDAVQSLIKKLELQHFESSKIPEELKAAEFKDALVAYHHSLLAELQASEVALSQLQSQVF